MASGYVTSGMTLSRILEQLTTHGAGGMNPRSLWRIAKLFHTGLFASGMAIEERMRFTRQLAALPIPDDPVFIVGHWRTGSTLLHRLMALDPGLGATTVFHCSFPDSLLTSGAIARPVMRTFGMSVRPMDGVPVGPDEPMEDEWALLRLVGSPLETLLFPDEASPFLGGAERGFGPSDAQADDWDSALQGFYRKVQRSTGRRLLIKNPFHSTRVDRLKRLFPAAQFVRIDRAPRDVLRSTRRMWELVGAQNTLRSSWVAPGQDELQAIHDSMLDTLDGAYARLPAGDRVTVQFEDLVADQPGTLSAVYEALGMEWPGHDALVTEFVEENRGYRRNVYEGEAASPHRRVP